MPKMLGKQFFFAVLRGKMVVAVLKHLPNSIKVLIPNCYSQILESSCWNQHWKKSKESRKKSCFSKKKDKLLCHNLADKVIVVVSEGCMEVYLLCDKEVGGSLSSYPTEVYWVCFWH